MNIVILIDETGRCGTPLNANPTVGDEYSGLATLLANLIAKYADVLELEDDTEKNQQPGITKTTVKNQSILTTTQRSLSQASLHFSLAQSQAA